MFCRSAPETNTLHFILNRNDDNYNDDDDNNNNNNKIIMIRC